MLNIKDDALVVEEKGIYSIEKFLVARRIMYWQVYLHKTVVAAELLVIHILKKAKNLALAGETLFCTKPLLKFLQADYNLSDFQKDPELLGHFSKLDDYDIFTCMKEWIDHPNKSLSILCDWMINRKLYRVEISTEPYSEALINQYKERTIKELGIPEEDVQHFVFTEEIQNNAYNPLKDSIKILYKNGSIKDIAEASDQLNISSLSSPVTKYFLCYPKTIKL